MAVIENKIQWHIVVLEQPHISNGLRTILEDVLDLANEIDQVSFGLGEM